MLATIVPQLQMLVGSKSRGVKAAAMWCPRTEIGTVEGASMIFKINLVVPEAGTTDFFLR